MRWMKIEPACDYAGKLNRKVLYQAVKKGLLKAAHIGAGRNLLFCEQWIDEWLNSSLDEERP